MNSRERVRKVLNNELPDKIPIDFGSTPATSISPIAYYELRNELVLKNNLFHVPNFAFQSVYPEDEIIEKFNIDLIDAGRAFIELVDWKMWQITDDISCLIPDYIDIEYDVDDVIYLKNKDGFVVAKKRKKSFYFDSSPGPFEKMDSIPTTFNEEDLIKTVWDIPILPFNFDILDDSIFNIFVKWFYSRQVG